MRLWCSAEVDRVVLAALTKTEDDLKSRLNSALNCVVLADVDLELCYVPIVMGIDFAEFYPPRSSYSKSESKVFHSPQLSFGSFRNGTPAERERGYIEGLLLAKPLLCSAGLDEKQTQAFEANLRRLLI